MESSAQSIAYELLENTILPSILLFFTSCAICLWLGVFVGAYLSNLRMKAPMSSSAVNDGKSKADKYNVVSLQMNSSVYPKRIVKVKSSVWTNTSIVCFRIVTTTEYCFVNFLNFYKQIYVVILKDPFTLIDT